MQNEFSRLDRRLDVLELKLDGVLQKQHHRLQLSHLLSAVCDAYTQFRTNPHGSTAAVEASLQRECTDLVKAISIRHVPERGSGGAEADGAEADGAEGTWPESYPDSYCELLIPSMRDWIPQNEARLATEGRKVTELERREAALLEVVNNVSQWGMFLESDLSIRSDAENEQALRRMRALRMEGTRAMETFMEQGSATVREACDQWTSGADHRRRMAVGLQRWLRGDDLPPR